MNFKEWLENSDISQVGINEKLYHATPYMNEIKNNGLKAKAETGISTFGSAGTIDQHTISVTHSYNQAIQYAHALKLLAEAAHGEMSLSELKRILKQYGAPEWYFNRDNHFTLRKIAEKKLAKLSFDTEEINDFANEVLDYLKGIGDAPPYVDEKEKIDITTSMLEELGVYTKGFFPVIFGGNLEKYKSWNENNIGVVELRLKEPTDLKIFKSENEYRIPPEKLIIYDFKKVR